VITVQAEREVGSRAGNAVQALEEMMGVSHVCSC
jgi:hypothetical protein